MITLARIVSFLAFIFFTAVSGFHVRSVFLSHPPGVIYTVPVLIMVGSFICAMIFAVACMALGDYDERPFSERTRR